MKIKKVTVAKGIAVSLIVEQVINLGVLKFGKISYNKKNIEECCFSLYKASGRIALLNSKLEEVDALVASLPEKDQARVFDVAENRFRKEHIDVKLMDSSQSYITDNPDDAVRLFDGDVRKNIRHHLEASKESQESLLEFLEGVKPWEKDSLKIIFHARITIEALEISLGSVKIVMASIYKAIGDVEKGITF